MQISIFIAFATSLDRAKGKLYLLYGVRPDGGLAGFTPLAAVFDDPIGQSMFKSDIAPRLLGFDPLMS